MTVDQTILANLVKTGAAAAPTAELLTFVDFASGGDFREQHRDYLQLWDNGQRMAAALSALGLRRGQHFALLMQNHPEFVEAMVASSILGSVFVPIDPRARGERLTYSLDLASCRGIVVADYALDAVLAEQ